jgi:hypothetical protein
MRSSILALMELVFLRKALFLMIGKMIGIQPTASIGNLSLANTIRKDSVSKLTIGSVLAATWSRRKNETSIKLTIA